MPLRPLACLAAALVLASVMAARGSDTVLSPALAAVHARLDAHDIPGARTALASLATQSLEVAEADIAKFAALYPANARTVKPSNRRLVLSSL